MTDGGWREYKVSIRYELTDGVKKDNGWQMADGGNTGLVYKDELPGGGRFSYYSTPNFWRTSFINSRVVCVDSSQK